MIMLQCPQCELPAKGSNGMIAACPNCGHRMMATRHLHDTCENLVALGAGLNVKNTNKRAVAFSFATFQCPQCHRVYCGYGGTIARCVDCGDVLLELNTVVATVQRHKPFVNVDTYLYITARDATERRHVSLARRILNVRPLTVDRYTLDLR